VAEIAAVMVPYELGRLRDGVGCGPEHLLERGAVAALESGGQAVRTELVEMEPRFAATGLGEADAAFELIRLVAERVGAARERGAFPILFAGSCFNAVGSIMALNEPGLAVAYFDAHPDFSEPATTTSGYFDSMGLAVLTGGAWQGMLAEVAGARPVPERRVILAGARDFDPSEESRLRESDIVHLTADRLRSPDELLEALRAMRPPIGSLYVHLDLDVLDSAEAAVNIYAAAGGLRADELVGLVDALFGEFPVAGVSLTAYDPSYDAADRVPPIANRVLETIARSLAG
jgi:arginase